MGLPTDLKEFQIPGYVIKTLYVIGFLRDILYALCSYFGLPSFLDHTSGTEPIYIPPTSSSLVDEVVPVVRFLDLLTGPEDCCTVCLSDFESDDKVRQLPNCQHVFHHSCLDRWIVDCGKMTCPICRNQFLPEEKYTPVDWSFESVWLNSEPELPY